MKFRWNARVNSFSLVYSVFASLMTTCQEVFRATSHPMEDWHTKFSAAIRLLWLWRRQFRPNKPNAILVFRVISANQNLIHIGSHYVSLDSLLFLLITTCYKKHSLLQRPSFVLRSHTFCEEVLHKIVSVNKRAEALLVGSCQIAQETGNKGDRFRLGWA